MPWEAESHTEAHANNVLDDPPQNAFHSTDI